MIVNIAAMEVLWGAVFTAMVLAVRVGRSRRSDPPAPMGTGLTRAEAVAAVGIARGEMDNDESHRRLM